jgi:hypothetical protein
MELEPEVEGNASKKLQADEVGLNEDLVKEKEETSPKA